MLRFDQKVIKEVFFNMKKYLLVSLTILFAAAFVWAADATVAEPKIDVTADATLSWGIDFGTGAKKIGGVENPKAMARHGFENKASWAVKFPLISKGNMTSTKTDVPVYGEVILKDIELGLVSEKGKNGGNFSTNGKVAGISAKLFFYGAYMVVFDKPSFKANYAKLWEPIDKNDLFDEDEFAFAPKFNGAGFKVGYANKDLMGLDVGLKLGSNGNWKSKLADTSDAFEYYSKYFDGDTQLGSGEEIVLDNGNIIKFDDDIPSAGWYLVKHKKSGAKASHSKYGIGLDFSMKPLDKMLGIGFTVNSTLTNAKTYINNSGNIVKGYNTGVAKTVEDKSVTFNFGVGLTSEPIDGLTLKLGFDGGSKYNTGNVNTSGAIYAFAWDTSFDAGYKWVSGGVYVASPGTGYAGESGRATDMSKKHITDLAAYVKFETKADKADASNLVEGLEAGAFFGLYELLTYANNNADRKVNRLQQLPMLVKVWGAYKVNINDAMWIKPFAHVWMATNNYVNKNSGYKTVGLAYDVGLTYQPVEKVAVEAKWQHGTINKNHYHLGVVNALYPMNENGHRGRLVFSLKVSY